MVFSHLWLTNLERTTNIQTLNPKPLNPRAFLASKTLEGQLEGKDEGVK